ncbi:MAG: hypothetical protein ACJA0Q_000272 [Saprospiraceae bacterium]|jgi:hypothetical protein
MKVSNHSLFIVYFLVLIGLGFGLYTETGTEYMSKYILFYVCPFVLSYYLLFQFFKERLGYSFLRKITESKIILYIRSKSLFIGYAFVVLIGIVLLMYYFYFGYFSGWKAIFEFDYYRIYEIRRSVTEDVPTWFNYLSSFTIKAILPFTLLFLYVKKQWKGLAVVVLLALFLGINNMQKSYFLIFYFPILFFTFYNRKWVHLGGLLVLVFVGIYSLVCITNPSIKYSYYKKVSSILAYENTQTENTQSEKALSKKAQSESAQSENTQSEKALSKKAQSDSAQSENTQSEKALSKKAQSDIAQSKNTQSEKALSKKAQSESVQSKNTQSKKALSKKAQSDIAQSENTQSEKALSKKAQSESAQSKNTQSEKALSKKAQSESAQSKNTQSKKALSKKAQSESAQSKNTQSEKALSKNTQSEKKLNEMIRTASTRSTVVAVKMLDNSNDIVVSTLFQRTVFLPGKMAGKWLNVVPKVKPFLGFGGYSILSRFTGETRHNYSLELYPILYPVYHKGGYVGSVNVASFMNDYVCFGWKSVALGAVVLSFVLVLVSLLFQGNPSVLFAVNIMPVLMLSSTKLSILLFSGGWGLLILLSFVLLRDQQNKVIE